MGSKRVVCTVCNYSEEKDHVIDYKNVMCPGCISMGTMIDVIAMPEREKKVTKPRKESLYYYLASNRNCEWHDINDSKDGEISAVSSVSAYNKVKDMYGYKDVIIFMRGGQE